MFTDIDQLASALKRDDWTSIVQPSDILFFIKRFQILRVRNDELEPLAAKVDIETGLRDIITKIRDLHSKPSSEWNPAHVFETFKSLVDKLISARQTIHDLEMQKTSNDGEANLVRELENILTSNGVQISNDRQVVEEIASLIESIRFENTSIINENNILKERIGLAERPQIPNKKSDKETDEIIQTMIEDIEEAIKTFKHQYEAPFSSADFKTDSHVLFPSTSPDFFEMPIDPSPKPIGNHVTPSPDRTTSPTIHQTSRDETFSTIDKDIERSSASLLDVFKSKEFVKTTDKHPRSMEDVIGNLVEILSSKEK